jgi:hypothetical protein
MKLLAKIGLWGFLAGGTASALYADPAGGWLSPNGVGTSTPGAAPDPNAAVHVDAASALSPADLQARVHLLREQTRADARHVQYLQQIARKEKDVIKLNCVNDKLVQIKPEMNLADSAESQLGAANDAARIAAFDAVAQSADSVRRLREEADQCIGEPITQGGSESSNSFTGPTAPDDPTKGLGGGQIEPPGYASPFN